jgi:DeoR family transcriptional regulator, fructose operon transcriptional repressor
MLKDERDKQILRQLLRDGEVTVEQLAERFETSPTTIRRELADLEEAGLLLRTHGGAVQVGPMLYEPFRRLSSFGARDQMQAAEKRRIGWAAAGDDPGWRNYRSQCGDNDDASWSQHSSSKGSHYSD